MSLRPREGHHGPAESEVADPAGAYSPPREPQVRVAPREVGRRMSLAPALVVLDVAVPLVWVLLRPEQVLGVTSLVVGAMVCWAHFGLYRNRFGLAVLDDLPVLMLGVAAGTGGAAALGLAISKGVLPDLSTFLTVFTCVVILGRLVLYRWMTHARRTGLACVGRVVIVGEGPTATRLARNMDEHPELGLIPVGVIGGDDAELPRLGEVNDLQRVIPLYGISHVLLASGAAGEEQLLSVLRACRFRSVKVYEVSRFGTMRWAGGARSDAVWGIPVADISSTALTGIGAGAKRITDIVLSICALIVLAPLMAAVALAVRLRISRHVLFSQERVGRSGEIFTLLKFTSMSADVAGDPNVTWSIVDHARLSRLGRFIRATSLDEMPQLINVLRGDMSLVGPRPERPYYVDQYSESVPEYQDRHRLPVGMTGFSQVHGLRGDTSIADRAVFDNVYIENWSLWLDVKILLRTIISVLGRRGG